MCDSNSLITWQAFALLVVVNWINVGNWINLGNWSGLDKVVVKWIDFEEYHAKNVGKSPEFVQRTFMLESSSSQPFLHGNHSEVHHTSFPHALAQEGSGKVESYVQRFSTHSVTYPHRIELSNGQSIELLRSQ